MTPFCFPLNKVWFMKLNDMQINQINLHTVASLSFNTGVVFAFQSISVFIRVG